MISEEKCPYENIGNSHCHDCVVGDAYGGCAIYKYSNVRGPQNVPEWVGVLDQGRLLELCHQ
jgi:hypothetical protein